MKLLYLLERVKFIMPARVFKKNQFLSRLKAVFLIAIGLTLLFSTPCWSKSFEESNKNRIGKRANDNPRLAEKKQTKKLKPRKKLSLKERQHLKQKAKKWQRLSPEKQDELRSRLRKLKSLPTKERTLYKKRFKQLKELPPGDQADIRKKLKKMDRLTPEEKEAIRKKFNSR